MNPATETIWKDYHSRLHRFIENRVQDSSRADDILQDVFVRIHSHIDTLQEAGKIQSWVYQITRNAIIDHYRTDKKLAELPESLTADVDTLKEQIRQEVAHCLLPMVQSLPDPYRQAIMLAEIEGLPQKAVAEKLGLSFSGAKSRIQRARSLVRDLLDQCCHFTYDGRGNVIDYERHGPDCGCDTC